MVKIGHPLQCRTEVRGEKRRDDSETDEANADQKPRLERLGEADPDTNAKYGEDDRHHHRSAKTDYV